MTKTHTLAFTIPVSHLDQEPHSYHIEADAEDRAALVERLGIVSLDHLVADVRVWDAGAKGVGIEGQLKASLVQRCIASLKDVPEEVDTPFELMLVDSETADRMDADEAYLDPEIPDYDALEGDEVPVGEIVAQTLAISMNPYPRAEGAEIPAAKGAKVTVNEPEIKRPNPFAVLEKLRDES